MPPKRKKIACGHPEAKHKARGMCALCYYKWYRSTSPGERPELEPLEKQSREETLDKKRQYQRDNKERSAENSRVWRANNRERVRRLSREWCRKNPEKVKAKLEKYRNKDIEATRRRNREYLRKHASTRKAKRDFFRTTVLTFYGGKCACCGERNYGFLTIDHVNNDGAEHKRQVGGSGGKMYRWLIKNNYPGGFQVLCWNCNCGRARNGGICPHKEVTE